MFFRTLTKTSKFLPLAIAFSFSSEYFRNCNKYPIYALNVKNLPSLVFNLFIIVSVNER